MSWLSRYRHSKGFGVHSPFAFRFITEVLGERCQYYDFSRLTSAHQRIVYRIAARISPATFGVAGDADASPVGLACPLAEQRDGAVDLLVAGPGALPALLIPTIDACGVVVIDGRSRPLVEAAKAYLDTKDCGMSFDNGKDFCVLVAYAHLPRQDFSVML